MNENWAHELEHPKLPPNPVSEAAARHPVQLLAGLAAGLLLSFFVGLFYWPAAPAVPFVLGTFLLIGRGTIAFGTGLLAAGCSVATFLASMAIVFLVF